MTTRKSIIEFFKAISIVVRHGSDVVFRDSLTGLYNRLFFNEVFEKEIVRSERYKRPLTIVFLDVDGLKQINDILGHQEGDSVLKRVGRLILRNCRKSDIPARWGGDEFLILLPETDIAEAERLVERILTEAGDISLSYGLTSWREGFSSLEDFVAEVDKKMYVSKKARPRT